MSIKIEVGRFVTYICEDSKEDKETNFYPSIGTLGIITEVCNNGCIVVNWQGNNSLNGDGYCHMTDVKYLTNTFFDYALKYVLKKSISDDYCDTLIEAIGMDVMKDVLCCSAWGDGEDYNEDDIKLAIGRALISKLGIDK